MLLIKGVTYDIPIQCTSPYNKKVSGAIDTSDLTNDYLYPDFTAFMIHENLNKLGDNFTKEDVVDIVLDSISDSVYPNIIIPCGSLSDELRKSLKGINITENIKERFHAQK